MDHSAIKLDAAYLYRDITYLACCDREWLQPCCEY